MSPTYRMIMLASVISACLLLTVHFAEGSHHHPHNAGTVITLTDTSFEHDTQATTGSTTGDWFVKFYAPWCGHCKNLAPIWSEVATELKEIANVAQVDCTKDTSVASRFGIKSYPTLIYFHNGRMYPYTGSRTKDNLVAFGSGDFQEVPGQAIPVPQNLVYREIPFDAAGREAPRRRRNRMF